MTSIVVWIHKAYLIKQDLFHKSHKNKVETSFKEEIMKILNKMNKFNMRMTKFIITQIKNRSQLTSKTTSISTSIISKEGIKVQKGEKIFLLGKNNKIMRIYKIMIIIKKSHRYQAIIKI